LRPLIDLHLLKDSLAQLQETSYFSPLYDRYVKQLLSATEHVLQRFDQYSDTVVRQFCQMVWSGHKYLSGSTSKEASYEMQYCLNRAFSHWSDKECVVSSALLPDKDFHLRYFEFRPLMEAMIPDFDSSGFDTLLVMVGVPRLYRHAPLFAVPLFHELGHFIDFSNGISDLSMLVEPPTLGIWVPDEAQNRAIEQRHRAEYFADLFGACYIGEVAADALNVIAPGDNDTPSHPATHKRVKVVDDFINGKSNPIITLFQTCLARQGLPQLSLKFDRVQVDSDFDDTRPFSVLNDRDLYGVFPSAWGYLSKALDDRSAPWIKETHNAATIERTVNNLTEKTIRNFAVVEKWKDVDSQ
jgi:hypothetical protein